MAAKTVEAYTRDVGQFLSFLTTHLAGSPKLADMKALTTTDIRAFMAARRNDGAGSRTLARGIAGIRSLVRFLEKGGEANGAALRAIRPPRQKRSLPKPLGLLAASDVIDAENSLDDEPWIAARNAAVLALLYGAGLRISEALAIPRGKTPPWTEETLRIRGKGGKERLVPVLPAVATAIDQYLRQCPYTVAPDGPLFLGARGGPLNPRLVQRAMEKMRSALGLPATATPARAPPFVRHASSRQRRRPPRHPGAAWPRQFVDDADLYRRRHRTADGGLREGAPARLTHALRRGWAAPCRQPRHGSPARGWPRPASARRRRRTRRRSRRYWRCRTR